MAEIVVLSLPCQETTYDLFTYNLIGLHTPPGYKEKKQQDQPVINTTGELC